ncbi:hypothetical protein VPH35_119917 [Triticum aestivum]
MLGETQLPMPAQSGRKRRWSMDAAEPEIPMWDSDDDGVVDLKTKAELQELHIACVKSFTELDPWKNLWVHTHFWSFNIGDFDLDREFSVYVTVLARDTIDYRCVSLFKNGREDPQIINSKLDNIYFELNLRVKGDAGDEDFSKGVVVLHVGPYDPESITRVLSSWLSRVELVLAPVESPVAASLEVNVLKGAAPFSAKICAGTSKNPMAQMILYDSRDTKSSSSIVLTHNLVAVPDLDDEEDEIGVYVRFLDDDGNIDDEDAGTVVNLAYPAEEQVCSHGAWEMQVKVSWTAILCKPMAKHVLTRGASIPRAYLYLILKDGVFHSSSFVTSLYPLILG